MLLWLMLIFQDEIFGEKGAGSYVFYILFRYKYMVVGNFYFIYYSKSTHKAL